MIAKRIGRGARKPEKPACLTPECEREPRHRGLCTACYRTALRAVAAKKTTWERLIAAKLAKPLPPGAPMTRAIQRAMKGNP